MQNKFLSCQPKSGLRNTSPQVQLAPYFLQEQNIRCNNQVLPQKTQLFRCLPCKFQVHARKSGLPCQRALPLPPSYCDGGTAKCSRMRFSSIFSSLARRGPSTHHPVSLPRASNRSRARSPNWHRRNMKHTDPGPKSALSRQVQTNPGLQLGHQVLERYKDRGSLFRRAVALDPESPRRLAFYSTCPSYCLQALKKLRLNLTISTVTIFSKKPDSPECAAPESEAHECL